MPKLNASKLAERISEVIEQLERGEEVEAKKNKTLLTDEQQQALEDAWDKQQALRKEHRPPKTEEEKKKLDWKDKREVRIEIYKQALASCDANTYAGIKKEQQAREAKANRVFMDAWSQAVAEGKRGFQAESVGNIALTRAGLRVPQHMVTGRDKEIRRLEREILESMEDRLSDEEREHLEWLRDGKAAKKTKKV